MNHPEESILNARLYHAQKMQEAEAHRRAKKVTETHLSFWHRITGNLRAIKPESKNTRATEPTVLESAN